MGLNKFFMRKILLAAIAVLVTSVLWAQQKTGKVVYERTIQMQIQVSDNNEASAMMRALPKSRTDKFELTFGDNKSLWKRMEDDEIENTEFSGGNGMQIRMVGAGANDITYYDFGAARKVDQRELFDKKFLVEDTIRKLNWKLTGESQTILQHPCQKATAQNISMRNMMTMENGNMIRKEISDTSTIIAWFSTDIPVSAGPEIQGQLPGLVLGLEMNNGRTVYKALSISPTADVATIKEPTKGKKVTPAEFREETKKMFDQLQQNNPGSGNRVFRVNTN